MIKHKIPLILSIAFSSILIISIIVLAILQTNTKPNLPNPDEIIIYKKSLTSKNSYKKGTDEYDEIIKLYNKAFEKTYLAQLSDDDILSGALYENLDAPLWNDNNKKSGIYIEFKFEEPKKYIINRDNSTRRVDITSIIFEIDKNDSTKPLNIYYETEDSEAAKESTSTSNSNKVNKDELEPNYALTAFANTNDLYKYITTIS